MTDHYNRVIQQCNDQLKALNTPAEYNPSVKDMNGKGKTTSLKFNIWNEREHCEDKAEILFRDLSVEQSKIIVTIINELNKLGANASVLSMDHVAWAVKQERDYRNGLSY